MTVDRKSDNVPTSQDDKLLWQLIDNLLPVRSDRWSADVTIQSNDNLLPVRSDRWSADVTRLLTRGMGVGGMFRFSLVRGEFCSRVKTHRLVYRQNDTRHTPHTRLVGWLNSWRLTAMCRQTMCRWVATVCNVCMFVPVCMACGVSCVYICVAACVVWVYMR